MIGVIRYGGNMYGLVHYLQGKGRENEHENPHVVAGDDFLVAWHGSEELGLSSVREIAGYLEEPRETYGTKVRAKATTQDKASGERVENGYKDAHVAHIVLAVRGEDGVLGDERWQQIAQEFMDGMGFTEASGRAPARWVAIHHGLSKNGNDHIHIAASTVREDGTRWDRWRDRVKATALCRELEVKYGLSKVGSVELELGERGETPAEQRLVAEARDAVKSRGKDAPIDVRAAESAEARAAVLTHPQELAQRIRTAAAAASSEAEWIRQVRADGVVLKPFFAAGTTNVVTGYRAALKLEGSDGRSELSVFYGGGRLGRELSLPRLREQWEAPSLEAADAADAEWQAAFRGQPPVGRSDGRGETGRLDERAGQEHAGALQSYNERLVMTPYSDRVAWAEAARDVSAALSAYARIDKAHAVELKAAASSIARAGQLRRTPLPAGRRIHASPAGTAMLFMAAAAKPEDQVKIAAQLMLRQLMTTAKALAAHQRALGDLRQAEEIHRRVVAQLELIGAGAPRAAAPGEPAVGQVAAESAEERTRRVREAMQAGGRSTAAGAQGPAEPGRDVLPRPLPPARSEPGRGTSRGASMGSNRGKDQDRER